MKATCKVKRYLRFEGWDYAKGTSLSITIATAGEGLALYWKADGPHVLAQHSLAIKSGGGIKSGGEGA